MWQSSHAKAFLQRDLDEGFVKDFDNKTCINNSVQEGGNLSVNERSALQQLLNVKIIEGSEE